MAKSFFFIKWGMRFSIVVRINMVGILDILEISHPRQ